MGTSVGIAIFYKKGDQLSNANDLPCIPTKAVARILWVKGPELTSDPIPGARSITGYDPCRSKTEKSIPVMSLTVFGYNFNQPCFTIIKCIVELYHGTKRNGNYEFCGFFCYVIKLLIILGSS